MLSYVTFVSHLIGRPLAVTAEIEPRDDATHYTGPFAVSLTVHAPGADSVPLLDAEDLWALRDEALDHARACALPRFAA